MPDSVNVESITAAHFAPHCESQFCLLLPDGDSVPLTLREITHGIPQEALQREPFSLLFVGPKRPPLPQHIYTLCHEQMGTFELFLVPVAETGEERHYEAVFT